MTDMKTITVDVDADMLRDLQDSRGVPPYQIRLAAEQAGDRVDVDHPDQSVRKLLAGVLVKYTETSAPTT